MRTGRSVVTALALVACGLFGPDAANAALVWLWRMPVNSSTPWLGTPATDGSSAFLEYQGRVLVALDPSSGAERWRAVIGSGDTPQLANIVASSGHVVTAELNGVKSLNAANGATEWSYTPASYGTSTWQSADANTYYFGERDHRVTALGLASGTVRWSVDIDPGQPDSVYTNATAVSGDTVYVAARECQNVACGTLRGLLVALDASTGAELWRYRTPETFMDAFTLTVAGTHLVVGDLIAGSVYSVNRFTGMREWRFLAETPWTGPESPAAVVNDTVYVGMQDQKVYALDLASGQLLWKTPVTAGVVGVTACGPALFAFHLGLTKLDRATGRVVGTRGVGLDPEWPSTAGGAVIGNRIIVAGRHAVYGYGCDL